MPGFFPYSCVNPNKTVTAVTKEEKTLDSYDISHVLVRNSGTSSYVLPLDEMFQDTNVDILIGEVIGESSVVELTNIIGIIIQNKMNINSIFTSQIGIHN